MTAVTASNITFEFGVGQEGHERVEVNGHMTSAVATKLFRLGFLLYASTEKNLLAVPGIEPESPKWEPAL
uniref:Uncharacterized protein n=1 Tax=Arion vulgaris TaxID=1028688 RepID=A0A0B6ZUK7_9EUPU